MIYVFEHGEATRLTVLEMGRRGFPIYVLDVLSSIEDLADFYLTGSRYFGTQTKFSDVDLLTREDISLRKSIFVSSNDWIRKSSNYDSVDNGIVCTLRHQKGVDIQLCVDLETRKRAAAFLKANGMGKELKDLKDQNLSDVLSKVWAMADTIVIQKLRLKKMSKSWPDKIGAFKIWQPPQSTVPQKNEAALCSICGFPGKKTPYKFHCSNVSCIEYSDKYEMG